MNDNKIALLSIICIFILLLRDWSRSKTSQAVKTEITTNKWVNVKAWSSINIFCCVNQNGQVLTYNL